MIELLFITLLINYLFGPKTINNILFCGIFAWNGISPNTVSKDKLKILGIYNDNRGGHSIGMYINNKIQKSINPHNTFKDYWEHNIFSDKITNNVIIGHSRRASVGAINILNAQPTFIELTDENKKTQKIVLAHNGTISNYKEMAKTAEINIKGLSTDSQVLASLLLAKGPEILTTYIGGAAIIYSLVSEPNVLYVFKGMSSTYKNGTHLYEERPLYFYQEHKNSIYFSSEEGPLIAIASDIKLVHEVPHNTLFKVKDGKMTKVRDINRDDAFQKESYTNNYYNNNNIVGYNSKSFEPYNNTTIYQSKEYYLKTVTKIEDQYIKSINPVLNTDSLYFVKGRYYLGKEFATGKLFVDTFGTVYTREELFHNNIHPNSIAVLYFYRGLLIKDKDDYAAVLDQLQKGMLGQEDSLNWSRKLSEYSFYPVGAITRLSETYSYQTGENFSNFQARFFSGSFQPFFSELIYKFTTGDVREVIISDDPFYPEAFEDLMDGNNADKFGNYLFEPEKIDSTLADELIELYQYATIDNNSTSVVDAATELGENRAALEIELLFLNQIKDDLLSIIETKCSEVDMCTDSDVAANFTEVTLKAKKLIKEFDLSLTF